jgi:hypothetical protein
MPGELKTGEQPKDRVEVHRADLLRFAQPAEDVGVVCPGLPRSILFVEHHDEPVVPSQRPVEVCTEGPGPHSVVRVV